MSIDSITKELSLIAEEYKILEQLHNKLAIFLKQLATDKDYWISKFKQAGKKEELLYEIVIDEHSGFALYLVSDSAEITSPPHAHHTWAIIAGISGVELNRIFVIADPENKKVKEVKSVSVGPGDVIILLEDDIHSTEVVGLQPTYHLHLYGRNLKSLPSFKERIYRI